MDQIEEKEDFIPTPLQIKFAKVYLDIDTRRTREEMAEKIGVSRRTLYTWLEKKEFRTWLNTKKLELVNDSLIDIYKVAVRKAKAGNYHFARLLFEMVGDYRPGMKIDTGETELIRIEVVQSQAQKQGSDDKENQITIVKEAISGSIEENKAPDKK